MYIRKNFLDIESLEDLANILELNIGLLKKILQIPYEKRYTLFHIAKKTKGEYRLISKPNYEIKYIQRKLKGFLDSTYAPKDCVQGYINGRSVLTNAHAHTRYGTIQYVLNIDIEDFFPTIHFGRVRGMFQSFPYNFSPDIATHLARLTCTVNGLPQGSPTSPIISNIICRRLDNCLQKLAVNNFCVYTRYADDITISTTQRVFPESIGSISRDDQKILLSDDLKKIFEDNGFQINQQKINLSSSKSSQQITGITVNSFPNVKQSYIREIRAMLYDWEKNGYKQAQRKHHIYRGTTSLSFKEVLRGRIEYLGMVRGKHDVIYKRFKLALKELDPSVNFDWRTISTDNPAKVFIGYTRKDNLTAIEIYNRLLDVKHIPWLDCKNRQLNESWKTVTRNAIKENDIFLLILSKASFNKTGELQKDIKMLLEMLRTEKDKNRFIVPVKVGNFEIPSALSKLNTVPYKDWEYLMASIGKILDHIG